MLILAVNLKLDLFDKQLFNTLQFQHGKSDDTILFKMTILQAQRAKNALCTDCNFSVMLMFSHMVYLMN